MKTVVRAIFYENNNIIHNFFFDECLYKMESKDKLIEIDIKNDIIRFLDRDIDFSEILLDEELYKEKYEFFFNSWHLIQNFNGCKTIAY